MNMPYILLFISNALGHFQPKNYKGYKSKKWGLGAYLQVFFHKHRTEKHILRVQVVTTYTTGKSPKNDRIT